MEHDHGENCCQSRVYSMVTSRGELLVSVQLRDTDSGPRLLITNPTHEMSFPANEAIQDMFTLQQIVEPGQHEVKKFIDMVCTATMSLMDQRIVRQL